MTGSDDNKIVEKKDQNPGSRPPLTPDEFRKQLASICGKMADIEIVLDDQVDLLAHALGELLGLVDECTLKLTLPPRVPPIPPPSDN